MKRKLTEKEISVLKELYYDEIDYSKVVITNEHLFSKILKKFSGIVFDNTIVFTRTGYKDDFTTCISDITLLIHEMCHVWQFQNLKYRWYKAGIEHIKYAGSTYGYQITDHKRIIDFRFEQQGEIMADYYRLRQNNSPKVQMYEDVIYSIIKRKKPV